MSYTATDIKNLREKTGAGIMDCKKALEEAGGDLKKAEKIVKAKGMQRAEKKEDRETKEGYIGLYVHANGKIGAMVELLCETDFVGRNDEFRTLAKEIAMHVSATGPANVEALLAEEYIRDASLTIDQLVKQLSGKIGEKIMINRFIRFQVGE
ncbi:MAG: translation elongation factor Ts [Candidatus Pacebacteria bacterium CG10_big_fil_rev_8_21_14_0_10_44_11]|nr:MAG: translation elongation factor Ts [Candidatus Pacebacteria bacterium CG10_big_fil_rev_8_21_14_0_10_44_11]